MVNTSQYSESNQCRAESERWLGRLSAEFSGLEMSLACAVGYFISPKDVSVGHMLAAELSFKTKLALLSALFHRHTPNPAALALLKQFRKQAEMAEARRNALVHSLYWPSGPGALLRIKTTAKGTKGLDYQFEQMTPQTIEKVVSELEPVEHNLNRLMVDFDEDIGLNWTTYSAKFFGEFLKRPLKK